MVNGNIDKIILGASNSRFGELGIYQAAYNFINFIITFIGVLFLPLFPYLVRSYSEGKEKIKRTIKLVMKVVLMITIPISFGGFILADKIILLFYNEQYSPAIEPLKILMIYIFIISIREVYAYSLNAFGLEKKYLKVVGISATIENINDIYFYNINKRSICIFLKCLWIGKEISKGCRNISNY